MFRRLEDFLTCWKEESTKTLEVFQAIPDDAMKTAVTPEHRDLRRLGWHLVESLVEMPGHLGLAIEGAELIQDGFITAPPASMKEISEAYAKASASLAKGLEAWKDADLGTEDQMYGETWKRGFTLFVLVTHQTHHRAQMTVLMRQAGLKVPGIYGPAKEGWVAYGMNVPAV
jgi:uncharacterized damage-inducible protein DinB